VWEGWNMTGIMLCAAWLAFSGGLMVWVFTEADKRGIGEADHFRELFSKIPLPGKIAFLGVLIPLFPFIFAANMNAGRDG